MESVAMRLHMKSSVVILKQRNVSDKMAQIRERNSNIACEREINNPYRSDCGNQAHFSAHL